MVCTGLHALRYQPDELTDAMAWYLAGTQLPDGSWPGYDFRPPMEGGPIVGTAPTLQALHYYPPPVTGRISLAGVCLNRESLAGPHGRQS